ncbi:MAG: tryptophan synthase subunit alpha [Pseudomonadota bacterium]|nr:tryptophan synthase subunit alpha [Pseudomonadota bacterium]
MTSLKGIQRIEKRFKDLKKAGRPGLVSFITAGDPNTETSNEILKRLPDSGADIIEIGMPFSDPMADGPAIQASSQRALKNGSSMLNTLEMVSNFRKIDNETPIILMGYFNPIYLYGTEKFVADSKKSGVDGFIVVDLPPEESEMREPVKKAGLSFIYLIAPTTDSKRIPIITKHATGFIYYVSVTGITGTKSASSDDIATALEKVRKHTNLPIAVGFGITTKEKAREIGNHSEAVVVGSAFVNRISENLYEDGTVKDSCVDSVLSLVQNIASGLK